MKEFLADISADDVAAAVADFAQPPAFQWYSDSARLGPAAARDRASLHEHLESVATATSSVSLSRFDYNGGTQVGNFGYVLSKADADGNTIAVPGKGAVECSTGLLVAWSEGAQGASGE